MFNSIVRFIIALGVLILASSTAIAADADPVAGLATSVAVSQTSLVPIAGAELTTALTQSLFTPAPKTPKPTAQALRFGLYASFATLQALDAHSTLKAIRTGGQEANPFMKGIASQPATLIAVKAGTAAATIMLVDKLSKNNPVASVIVMTALNSAYATVVAHNYRIATR